MTDKTTKKEAPSVEDRLRDARRAVEGARKKFATDRKEMVTGRQDSLNEITSARGRAYKAVNDKAAQERIPILEKYEATLDKAEADFNETMKEASEIKQMILDDAHEQKKVLFANILQTREKELEPLRKKYNVEAEEIEEGLKDELVAIDKKEKDALTVLKPEVEKLEEKLEKKKGKKAA